MIRTVAIPVNTFVGAATHCHVRSRWLHHSVGLVGGVREGPPRFCGHGEPLSISTLIVAVALKKFPPISSGSPPRRNTKTWLFRFRAYSRMRNLLKNFPLALMQPLLRWQIISDGGEGLRQQGANLASRAATGGTAMAFKVGDAVRLKSGGAQMTVSKLFKSPEGREMVQCTWFDKKPREH